MENLKSLTDFYKRKNVLISGITGFKGAWLAQTLLMLGAKVVGFGLKSKDEKPLYQILEIDKKAKVFILDISNFPKLLKLFNQYKPSVVFHLAAQPIVKTSYEQPRETYETNVLGTVNICECIRLSGCVKSFINVTTDKVYCNNDIENHIFKEDEYLDGFDPYSNSKSCSELVTHCYFQSFFNDMNIPTSTMRAGYVIGGGDFSDYRIIPDCYRSLKNKTPMVIRNPDSIRPYQFVMESIYCYISMAKRQFDNINLSSSYNVGPDDSSIVTTRELVNKFKEYFNDFEVHCLNLDKKAVHEAAYLKLDSTKIKKVLSYKPVLSIDEAIKYTVEWYRAYLKNEDVFSLTENQIKTYLKNL